jgi:hypothetical protein
MAIWGAAALSVVFVLLLSAVLLQPVLGSEGDNNDGVITTNSLYDPQNYDNEWYGDDDHDDEYEDEEHEHDEHEDDDDD